MATVMLETIAIVQIKKKKWLNKPKWHYRGIASFYIVNRYERVIFFFERL